MSLYKGPVIFGHRSRKNSQPHQIDVLHSNLNVPSANAITRLGIGDWQLGSICLFTDCLCNGIYLNLQTPLLRRYPAPVSITAYTYLFGSLLLTITGLFSVSSRSDWYINQPGDILAFVYAGAIPSAMNFAVQTWCTQKRGPVLVTAYIPVQTVVSALLAYFFLGDSIHFGSLLGGILIVMGLYLVVWGQDKDRHLASRSIKARLTADGLPVIEPMETLKTPLLGYQIVQ
ncbi:hypothetical protein O6H91_11G052500 [Diphasiastrum complanatum]|nr:hypothetical protein O6H91_11G052500 [Diphasiastrum complanatum]